MVYNKLTIISFKEIKKLHRFAPMITKQQILAIVASITLGLMVLADIVIIASGSSIELVSEIEEGKSFEENKKSENDQFVFDFDWPTSHIDYILTNQFQFILSNIDTSLIKDSICSKSSLFILYCNLKIDCAPAVTAQA